MRTDFRVVQTGFVGDMKKSMQNAWKEGKKMYKEGKKMYNDYKDTKKKKKGAAEKTSVKV